MMVRSPLWIRRLASPGAEAFAGLYTLDSFCRALVATAIPLEALALLQAPHRVSLLYFLACLCGLAATFTVPWFIRRTARRWVFSAGGVLLILAPLLIAGGGIAGLGAGMALRVTGVVVVTVCINLYILDFVDRRDFVRSEPKRMFYAAGAWTLGPLLGVLLRNEVAPWAPYALACAGAFALLGYFWFLRLTDSPAIQPAAGPPPSMFANLRRFVAQPRLSLAWLNIVGRCAFWGSFFVYAPIYAVTSGLGELAGGLLVSAGTASAFLSPLGGALIRRHGLRRTMVSAALLAAAACLGVAAATGWAWLGAGLLLAAAFAVSMMDASGNSLFLLAVRPRERAPMTAVYSTYRDAGELLPQGVFSVLLRAFELPAVFVATGLGLLAFAGLSRRIHPRLGRVPQQPAALQSGLEPAPRA